MIDRITDAGQCDYYEVIIKVIKQGLLDNCLKQMRCRFIVNQREKKLIGYCKQHRTADFRIRLIRDEKENTFNCTRLGFEQHKHGEKNKKFTDLHLFIRSLLRQYGKQKSLGIFEKKLYSGKPYTVTSD